MLYRPTASSCQCTRQLYPHHGPRACCTVLHMLSCALCHELQHARQQHVLVCIPHVAPDSLVKRQWVGQRARASHGQRASRHDPGGRSAPRLSPWAALGAPRCGAGRHLPTRPNDPLQRTPAWLNLLILDFADGCSQSGRVMLRSQSARCACGTLISLYDLVHLE